MSRQSAQGRAVLPIAIPEVQEMSKEKEIEMFDENIVGEGQKVRILDPYKFVSPDAVPHGEIERYDPNLGQYLINLYRGYYCEEGTRIAYNNWYSRDEFEGI